jgi:hypothetical protein
VHKDFQTGRCYLGCLRDIFPVDPNNQEFGALDSDGAGFYNCFRPEFLQYYKTALCSDAFSPMSGASKREIEVNDEEISLAGRFLRENWIPSFVKCLDNMEICPFDSASFTQEMHQRGINLRYLGIINLKKVTFAASQQYHLSGAWQLLKWFLEYARNFIKTE